MMIEAEWEDMIHTNSPCDIFTPFAHYFQLNFDETSLIFNEGDIKVLWSKDNPAMTKITVTQGFQ